MATKGFRSGIPDIAVGSPNTIVLPTCATLAFSASGSLMTDYVHNSIQAPLATGVNYNVVVALVGKDNATDGWSVTPTSAPCGQFQITNVQNSIKVMIPNASWLTNFQYAGYVAVFLAQGAGNYQLAQCAPVDPSFDMCITISAVPLPQAESWPLGTLTSTTTVSSNALGDRKPTGYTFTTLTPTTEDITLTDSVGGSVTFTPNNSSDFTIATARSFGIQFKTEANDVKTFIQASAGEFSSTSNAGRTFQMSARAINTAQVIIKGNTPLIVTMPPDPTLGVGEKMLCTSMLLQNQESLALVWSKKNQSPVSWSFQTVPNDVLMFNQPTVYTYLAK